MSHAEGIILAAGKGTRMNASPDKNKVMHEVGGKPMLWYPIEALRQLNIARPIVVVGFAKESIKQYFGDTVEYAIQQEMLGTADAVKAAISHLSPETTEVFMLYGDHTTFYTAAILEELLRRHHESGATMTLITTHTNPTGYGRILRDANGNMIGIVEEKNATPEQRAMREINTGNAIYQRSFLEKYLPQIQKNSITGEYYFTDIVSLGVQHGEKIETYVVEDEKVAMGINTPEQLEQAKALMQQGGC